MGKCSVKKCLNSNILSYMRCLLPVLQVQLSPDSFNYSLTSVSSTSQGLVEKTQSYLFLLEPLLGHGNVAERHVATGGLLNSSQMPCQMIQLELEVRPVRQCFYLFFLAGNQLYDPFGHRYRYSCCGCQKND